MTPEDKLNICTEWYNQKAILAVKKEKFNKVISTKAVITEQPKKCSGVWGYGGDSIAIYFDREPFCSIDVIIQNRHLLNGDNLIKIENYLEKYKKYMNTSLYTENWEVK